METEKSETEKTKSQTANGQNSASEEKKPIRAWRRATPFPAAVESRSEKSW